MTVINKNLCVGCKICQKFCTVDAFHFDVREKKCFVDQDRCTECYVCLRQKVCPKGAIEAIELDSFYKQFQHVLSDPVENHGVTGVTGRGTEEVKTNDVSGRVKKGEVGICVDMGRPGMGVYLRDAEKVAMACAAAGVKLASQEHTPLAALMPDLSTGKLVDECLHYHLLSVIVEGKCEEDNLKQVLEALKKVEKEIDTVFSLGLIIRTDENGETKTLDCLNELNIPQPHRGKVNVGLGKPLSLA
ncbi:NAD-dependent dihydropyrimidine dehydrogenase PreA subunit [Anaerosolibacter carboniphilus]|uniref:NAD-dependent dihydropyrimidine dehydrogenase PreA subunit n=1 Tax=Anaerosolibacter carboniphilus TaxID=1417629 RepID=A0A841L324_9FIRM|nr:4Fe-4S binding protein [Anaerosolibacter carboniphilus]MBB6218570.1 NAD-dependent dihydropyrimidine dehydrogenase PreA subunit [Anaerosolibacter carboniphilus]